MFLYIVSMGMGLDGPEMGLAKFVHAGSLYSIIFLVSVLLVSYYSPDSSMILKFTVLNTRRGWPLRLVEPKCYT